MSLKWKAKAVVQKTISLFPQRERLNYFFQKYVTKGVELSDKHFGFKIEHARDHIAYLHQFRGTDVSSLKVLELGTGWYPIIPLMMYLMDVGEVVSVDIQSWMTQERQIRTIEKLTEWRNDGKLQSLFPKVNEEKWQRLQYILSHPEQFTKDQIDAEIGLTPMLMDARKLPFDDGYFDFICSNNTFEHIPADILKGILSSFWRLLHPQGLMSHFIDLSDHFAHFDQSITIYNFLQFSQKTWDRIDNSIQPQNRLRWRDYVEMYQSIGVPIDLEATRPGDQNLLKTVHLHPEYAGYTAQELAISHGYIVSLGGELK